MRDQTADRGRRGETTDGGRRGETADGGRGETADGGRGETAGGEEMNDLEISKWRRRCREENRENPLFAVRTSQPVLVG
ncbi:hypothetical protein LINPERHAP2_LOCUS7471 [Linum perenne]